MRIPTTKWWWLVGALVLALTNAVLLLDAPLELRVLGAVTFMFALPGAALIAAIFPRADTIAISERIVLSAGASVALAVILLWGIFLSPFHLQLPTLVAALDAIVILFGLTARRQFRAIQRNTTSDGNYRAIRSHREFHFLIGLAVIVAVSLFFFLWRLSFGEVAGDERNVVAPAIDILLGDKSKLYGQPKGPAQILLVMWIIRLSGSLLEGVERLPFAVCAVIATTSFALLAHRRFKLKWVVLLTILLILQGLLLGMARFIQYQMFVVAMTLLAVHCVLRAWNTRHSSLSFRYELLAALFLGSGMLAHYDALMAVPALLYVFVRTHHTRLTNPSLIVKAFSLALLVLAVGAPFYLLLLQDPVGRREFEWQYLVNRLNVGRAPFNHLNDFFWDIWDYDSRYRASVFYLALAAVVVFAMRRYLRRMGSNVTAQWRIIGALFGAIGTLLVIWQPDALTIANINWSFVPFGMFFACLWPMLNDPYWKAIFLWIFAALFFTGFWMALPYDHYFVVLPALLLVAGKGMADTTVVLRRRWRMSRNPWLQRAAWAVTLAWLGLLAAYSYLENVAYFPQTLLIHPERNIALFGQLTSPRVTDVSYFVTNVGWRVVAVLYARGELRGEYRVTTLEEYMRDYLSQAWRPRISTEHYWILARPQKPGYYVKPPTNLSATFHLWGTITVEGESQIMIYQRDDGQRPPPPRTLAVEDYEADWARLASLTRLEQFQASHRDDQAFYTLSRELLARGRAHDAIAFDVPETRIIFNQYYNGDLPYLNNGGDTSLQDYQRVWGVYWGMHGGPIEHRLAEQAYATTASSVGNIRLRLYGVVPDAPTQDVQASIGGLATLVNASFIPPLLKPNDLLPIHLTWRVAHPTTTRYKVFVHVANEQGVPVAQADDEPTAGLNPTNAWHADDMIHDRFGIWLPATMPSGRYRVLVGLYDPNSGERLTASAPDGSLYTNDAIPLGELTVVGK